MRLERELDLGRRAVVAGVGASAFAAARGARGAHGVARAPLVFLGIFVKGSRFLTPLKDSTSFSERSWFRHDSREKGSHGL